MKTHLHAALTQAAVDRVLDDVKYPVNVHEKRFPFDPVMNFATVDLSQSDFIKLKTWAKRKRNHPVAQVLTFEEESFLAEIEEVERSRDLAKQNKELWEGPSARELADWKNLRFKVKAHLAWIRVVIEKRPKMIVKVPKTDIQDLRTLLSATGELWVERPKLKCVKICSVGSIKFCCQWKWIHVWEKWASITVSSVKVKAAGRIEWSIDDFILKGLPRFKRLRLDYPILDKFPLEFFVTPDSFDALDAKKLTAAIPYVDNHYVVNAVGLPAGSELRLNIEFKTAS